MEPLSELLVAEAWRSWSGYCPPVPIIHHYLSHILLPADPEASVCLRSNPAGGKSAAGFLESLWLLPTETGLLASNERLRCKTIALGLLGRDRHRSCPE
jgi:hypothetical protein